MYVCMYVYVCIHHCRRPHFKLKGFARTADPSSSFVFIKFLYLFTKRPCYQIRRDKRIMDGNDIRPEMRILIINGMEGSGVDRSAPVT